MLHLIFYFVSTCTWFSVVTSDQELHEKFSCNSPHKKLKNSAIIIVVGLINKFGEKFLSWIRKEMT